MNYDEMMGRKSDWVMPANRGWHGYTEHEGREQRRRWRANYEDDPHPARRGHRWLDKPITCPDCGAVHYETTVLDGRELDYPTRCTDCRKEEAA